MSEKLDCLTNPSLYAEKYRQTKINGTTYLDYRDIKELIDKYVKGKNTLDYGCGFGKSSIFLKNLGLSVTGVDIGQDMIRYATETEGSGIKYKLITSANVPVDDNIYDLVFSSWVMIQVPSKSELNKIGREIYRILKPDGVFIMITACKERYNRDWLTINTVFATNEKLYSGSRTKTLFKDINLTIDGYFWTEEDYKEMIEGSNMKILEIHKPLGKDSDGYSWTHEKLISPAIIYIAKKVNNII